MTATKPTSAETQTQSEQRDWVALENRYYQHTFKRNLVMERGAGVRVWDANGTEYLDLVAGIATNVLGHAHPAVVRAIQEQATKLIHVSNLYINKRQVELAEQLWSWPSSSLP
jgi:acetylornithine/succinyldiaminopimelate/putrescine aminotransferase